MEKEIGAKEQEKILNDKIMKFAVEKHRTTQTHDKVGRVTGEVQGTSRKGM